MRQVPEENETLRALNAKGTAYHLEVKHSARLATLRNLIHDRLFLLN